MHYSKLVCAICVSLKRSHGKSTISRNRVTICTDKNTCNSNVYTFVWKTKVFFNLSFFVVFVNIWATSFQASFIFILMVLLLKFMEF